MASPLGNFLLGTQALLDLCATSPTAAQAWADDVPARRLRLTWSSLAIARAAIAQAGDAQDRARLALRLDNLADRLASHAAPLAFDAGDAAVWQALIHEPLLAGMPQVQRQFYATALARGLRAVETPHAHTAALQRLSVPLEVLG